MSTAECIVCISVPGTILTSIFGGALVGWKVKDLFCAKGDKAWSFVLLTLGVILVAVGALLTKPAGQLGWPSIFRSPVTIWAFLSGVCCIFELTGIVEVIRRD